MTFYNRPEFRALPFEEKVNLLPVEVLVTAAISNDVIGYSPLSDLLVNDLRHNNLRESRLVQDVIDRRIRALRSSASDIGTGAITILENNFKNYQFSRDPVHTISSLFDKLDVLLSPKLFSDTYLRETWPASELYESIQKPLWDMRRTGTGEFPVGASIDDTHHFGRHNIPLDMELFVYRAYPSGIIGPAERPEQDLSIVTPSLLVVRTKKDLFGKAARSLAEEYVLAGGDVRREETKMDIFDKAVPRDLVAMSFCYTTNPIIGFDTIQENYRRLLQARLFQDLRIRPRADSKALPFKHKRMYLTIPAPDTQLLFKKFVQDHIPTSMQPHVLKEEPRNYIEAMALLHRDLIYSELHPVFDHDNYAEQRKRGFKNSKTGVWTQYDPRHRGLIELVSEPTFSLRR